MLYILPPLRSQNPPAPWSNLICGSEHNNHDNIERNSWSNNNSDSKHPPRIRLRNLQIVQKNEDETTGFQDDLDSNRNSKSLSECYFAGKGTALVLPDADAQKSSTNDSTGGSGKSGGTQSNSTIQKHLQSMFYLLRQEETLKMAVKLESNHPSRTRYLVVVSRMGSRAEESCLLGIDCNEKTTVGLVLRVLANTKITLDGDGGFSVSVCERHHIFKPVSVQAMWSALQTLYKVSGKATKENYFQGGTTHDWVDYYEKRIESDRSCLNEWHAMDNLESRRPPSPDSIRTKPTERNETEKVIRATLKEIMMSVDLDEVTSKVIRSRLEEELDMDLGEYKSFIDQEMLVILGQMDAPTEIFDHVYLGSEWNASNYEELQKNGVGHILNVTREIDNFFPGTFDYLNIRVYDDEKTDLLKHWDDTYKYITKAKDKGSKVLVHCKMGVSRSASVVIAYAMKAYNWDFDKAMHHVKDKRSCIKPNTSFLSQLETYQGILDAMKNKEKLQRSKSETNLKAQNVNKLEKVLPGSEPTPVIQALSKSYVLNINSSGHDLRQMGERPKSWSPDNLTTRESRNATKSSPISMSLEDLSQKSSSKESVKSIQTTSSQEVKLTLARHVLMPCDNGESYSVSPNQIVHLPGHDSGSCQRIEERRSSQSEERKIVTNLATRFGTESSRAESSCCNNNFSDANIILRAEKVKADTWDPGEDNAKLKNTATNNSNSTSNSVVCDLETNSVISENQQVWTSSTVVKTSTQSAVLPNYEVPESQPTQPTVKVKNNQTDPFSNQLDRVFDREEKKQQRLSLVGPQQESSSEEKHHPRECPSRQSSWSSYDSAVVMGFSENNELSRHSSWGSGDTRTLPSRNSSWGSYDMRPRGTVYYNNEKGEKILHSTSDLLENSSSGIFPYDKEEIPWYPGTVKRTKQRLEGNSLGKHHSSDSITSSNLSLMQTPSSETLLFEFSSEKERPAEAVNVALLDSAKTTTTQHDTKTGSAISETININIADKQKNTSPCLARLSISAPEPASMMELIPQECSSLSRSESNVSNIDNINVPKDISSSSVVKTSQCSSVKQHRSFLENLHKDSQKSQLLSSIKKSSDEILPDNNMSPSSSSGIVMNLKKEFEAKSSTNSVESSLNNSEVVLDSTGSKPKRSRVNSLPSSPVSVHQSKEEKPPAMEDKNMKSLIGLFENNKEDTATQVKLRQKQLRSPNTQNRPAARHSCIEVSVFNKNPLPRIAQTPLITNLNKNGSLVDKNCAAAEYKRPPTVPVVRSIAATVIATAAKKQQQYGKSHPLARLNIKPRHNNPVYNTM